MCEWVITQKGQYTFDIYSFNLPQNTATYLKNLNQSTINVFLDGIPYHEIPITLKNYDVGLILYKPYSKNVINCISNKFYEYTACNLDVWFSNCMKTTHSLVTTNTYPKIVPVDFEQLNIFDAPTALSKNNCTYHPSTYFCENEYQHFLTAILH